jgi:L-aspartate oxidase
MHSDVIIVGAGAAGLATALTLNDRRVTVLAKAPLGEGAASAWAQGGIAAAIGTDDDTSQHAADTIAVAAGIAEAPMVGLITKGGPAAVQSLAEWGAQFDAGPDGVLRLGREAGHGKRRIVHAAGDATGREVMRALVAATMVAPWVAVQENVSASELLVDDGRVVGVAAQRGGKPVTFTADAIVLATGGIGQLYRRTTNPTAARGDGIALAARAGARLADLEFVQFHPTALDVGRDPMPLATEALRGEGAILVNDLGLRFMKPVHPDAELAPRDVVARAIWRQRQAGHKVYLDCRTAIGASFAARFPTVHGLCADAGIDPARELIPVAPATHYHMGGVATDATGRSSIAGLWACGEVASTGLHGGNRLASNSILEAVVMAGHVAADIAATTRQGKRRPVTPAVALDKIPADDPAAIARLRRVMDDWVGVVRDEGGLTAALGAFAAMERTLAASASGFGNMLTVAKLIAAAALRRRESRGSHFRSDFPEAASTWQHRQYLTLAEADAFIAERLGLAPAQRRAQA